MYVRLLLMVFFLLNANVTLGQLSTNDPLDKVPHFIKNGAYTPDSLFVKDLAMLKTHIGFDSLDTKILKKSVLTELLYQDISVRAPYTYTKLIAAIQTFKKSIGYIELRKGLDIYERLKNLPVNPVNWSNDKKLFERLGFTEADLEDFIIFISKPANNKLTYKEAYVAYIKEIDSLSVGK